MVSGCHQSIETLLYKFFIRQYTALLPRPAQTGVHTFCFVVTNTHIIQTIPTRPSQLKATRGEIRLLAQVDSVHAVKRTYCLSDAQGKVGEKEHLHRVPVSAGKKYAS